MLPPGVVNPPRLEIGEANVSLGQAIHRFGHQFRIEQLVSTDPFQALVNMLFDPGKICLSPFQIEQAIVIGGPLPGGQA
jgi:hypothetical protein